MSALLKTSAGRLFVAIVAITAALTAAGLVILWPGPVEARVSEGLVTPTERGVVEQVESSRCEGAGTEICRSVRVEIASGPDSGQRASIPLGSGTAQPQLAVGDQVRVAQAPAGPAGSPPTYSLRDFERGAPMLYLALLFGALVVIFGRLRGALSLVGLGLSLAVVVVFIVPGILGGKPPLAVAIVGSLAVMLATIPLAHGFGAKSVAAILGTSVSLLLTAALAVLFTDLTHLTGLASEEATLLQTDDAGLSIKGLLIAGMVIGALGVLDDMTISQSSAVMALRRANPGLGARALYGRALAIGQDHVSTTVNTLVLAYVGASLPVLLLFVSGQLGVFEAATVELVATEIVATLVGSIGLIAAAPITTALAALLAGRLPPEALGEPGDAHSH